MEVTKMVETRSFEWCLISIYYSFRDVKMNLVVFFLVFN